MSQSSQVSLTNQHNDYLLRANDPYAQAKYDIILEQTGSVKGKNVLFVGVGSGELAYQFAQRGAVVDAFDIDAKAIDLTKQMFQKYQVPVKLWQSSIEDLVTEQKYDIVLATDVIEHIEDDAAAVKKIGAVLKNDGIAIITVPALQVLFGFHDEVLGHFRRYSKNQLTQLFHKNLPELKLNQVRYFGFFLIPVSLLISRILRRPYPVQEVGSETKTSLVGSVLKFLFQLEKKMSPPVGTSLILIGRKS